MKKTAVKQYIFSQINEKQQLSFQIEIYVFRLIDTRVSLIVKQVLFIPVIVYLLLLITIFIKKDIHVFK